MVLTTKSTNHTPYCKPKFNERLHNVLSKCGYKMHGRYSTVSRISGLSIGGAKLLFVDDHPPKQYPTFLRLVEGLHDALLSKLTDTKFSRKSLEHYLLGNNDIFEINNEILVNDVKLNKPLDAQHISYVQTVQICDLVNKAGADINLNVFNDIELDKIEFIYSKVIRHIHENNIDWRKEESKIRDIATKLIQLAYDDII